MGGVLDQADGALGDRLAHGDGEHKSLLDRRCGERLGEEADAEVVLDHRQHLIHRGGLDVHVERQVVLQKEVLVKGVGARVLAQRNEGVLPQVAQAVRARRKVPELRAPEQNLAEGEQARFAQRPRGARRGRDDGAVEQAALQGRNCLRGGIVRHAQVHARVLPVKGREAVEQNQVQRRFARADRDRAAFEAAIVAQLLLAGAKLLVGHGDVRVQAPALGRERHAAVRAHEELAAQLLLEVVHAARDVRLVVVQRLGRPRKAAVLRHKVKNTVVIVGDHCATCFLISKTNAGYIKHIFYIF